MKNTLALAVVLFFLISSGCQTANQQSTSSQPDISSQNNIQKSEITYSCKDNKTIHVVLYQDTVSPSQSVAPTGTAEVTLSDGRSMKLAQTVSADGIRYANPDESFVFWSKGNGALVLENNTEKSYIGCIKIIPQPEGTNLSQIYVNGEAGFSLRLPGQAEDTSENYKIDESYRYQALGPGKEIWGVKFQIPSALAKGTNLSEDSYLSVEQLPQTPNCVATLFLGDQNLTADNLKEDDTTYSFASTTGAAAGNRYEEKVYALPGTNPCIAVRYFIHYGIIENYEPGTVKEFDKEVLLDQFDQIRRTLVVSQ